MKGWRPEAGHRLLTSLRVALVATTCVLAGCAMPPATEGGPADKDAKLLPLPRQLAVPPGAPARSNVPSVRYDLAVSGTGEPDDGVPGDGGPRDIFERGGASWYGIQFHQRKTASGERFDMMAMTAAHKTLPFNTRVCVRSLVNGSEVLVRITDRGPYAQGRIIDLSRAAAERIGLIGLGIKQVALTIIDREGMRCGGSEVEEGEAQAQAPAPARRQVKVPPRRRR
ncbi:rare lipoprotein A [Variovorax paradoxus]|nr:rare lipoprotein A [Variovorax paradoxus]